MASGGTPSSSSSLSIWKLSAADWSDLCKHLNLYGVWYQLGTRIGLDTMTLIQIKSSKGMYNGAEDILLQWASRNGSVTGLFCLLAQLDFQIGMHILKKYVDAKYHKYLKNPTEDVDFSFSLTNYDFNANKLLQDDKFSTGKFNAESNHLGGGPKLASYNIPHQPFPSHSLNVGSNLNSNPLRKISPPAKAISKIGEHKLNNLEAEPKTAQQQRQARSPSPAPGTSTGSTLKEEDLGDILCVPFEEIVAATDNFNVNNILGQGGFGIVYKGTWKKNTVAVKCLKPRSDRPTQPHISQVQLLNELKVLKKARIDNILNLYGVCLREESPCLIYQFMPNGSLEDRLLCKNNTPPLTWTQRSKIMEGTAKGLNYLHTLPTPEVHGDIKSANILLDQNMEAKIGDFGLSCEGPSGMYTHCKVSKLHGTQWYLPPEYLRDHHLSTKVDVYSYGTVLLEVATGQRAFKERRQPALLVDYVAEHSRNHILDSLRDIRAGMEAMPWFLGLLQLGMDCTSRRKKDRPDMATVMEKFEDLHQQQNLIDRVRRRSRDGTPLNHCPERQHLTPHDIQYIMDMNKLDIRGPPVSGDTIHPSEVREPPPSLPSTELGESDQGAGLSEKPPYSVPLLTLLGVGSPPDLPPSSDFSVNFSFDNPQPPPSE